MRSNLLMMVSGQYVCWNSHRSEWFLGPKRLSEIFFYHSSQIIEVLKVFPSAKLVWSYDKCGMYEIGR